MNSIFHRTSIRKYQEKAVTEEQIRQILKAGMQAPSARNAQPWEFYVVSNREIINALSETTPYSKCIAGAPVVIVSVYRKSIKLEQEMNQINMAIAQENMWLETDAIGLGGVWIGIAPFEERMDKVRKIIGLPESLEAFSLFSVGYPAEERVQQDRFEEDRIHYIK